MCQTSPHTTYEDGSDSGKAFSCLSHYLICLNALKAQYEFIHYALSELVVCGETEIVAANLRSFTDLLNHDSQPSISQQHMNVCLSNVWYHSDSFCWYRPWTTCALSRSVTSREPRTRQTLTKTDSKINHQVCFLFLMYTHTQGGLCTNQKACIHLPVVSK